METSSIDQRKLEMLLIKIGDPNDFDSPRPLVKLDEFFDGNNDYGSIWYNLAAPSPSEIHRILKEIEKSPEINGVFLEIMQHEDPTAWLVTNKIWFITSASVTEIAEKMPAEYQPDEYFEKEQLGPPDTSYIAIPEGMRAIGAWYD